MSHTMAMASATAMSVGLRQAACEQVLLGVAGLGRVQPRSGVRDRGLAGKHAGSVLGVRGAAGRRSASRTTALATARPPPSSCR